MIPDSDPENTVERLQQELEALRRDCRQLTLENKRKTRALDLLEKQIQRNKVSTEARENLNRVISMKRSELERYMNLLLGNCPDMILLFDSDDRVVYCTDSFLKLCGLPVMGLIHGQTCRELLTPYTSPEFIAQLQETVKRIRREKKTIVFGHALDFRGAGAPRSYTVQATPMLDENGGMEGSMLIFSDISEIVLAQQAAERANAAKSDFLATVSHEIRTPMNAIIGVAGMLKSTSLDEKQHEYLQNIQDSSHILLNLINDILDFSRIEAGKLELVEEYFRLGSLLRHLQSMFELMFEQKGLDFVCEFDQHLPEVVYGDDKRLRQILTNILNNALKYTQKGSVRFRAARGDGGLLFSVEDTGIGIQPEAIPRLFTAFEQLDVVQNKGITGTGLGLAITKQLCALMGGEIGVQSEYGVGSRFTVTLALREGQERDLPPESRKDAVQQFEAPGARVLLVDDIEINLQITAFMLEGYGVASDSALSGSQAIEKVAAGRYDMILMDHMMPEMSGVEATKIIRRMDGMQAVPIVALTANAVSGAMEMFLENGFDDFLSKPIDHTALAQCLLRWLPKEKIHLR